MAVEIAEAAPAFVRFVDVAKTYDGRTLVIEGLNLELREGEFLTLLGPSGSGKTTTLMMLAGFERPSAGEILLQGRPISTLPSWQRDFGMVFQDYALFPHMSVADNVAFPLTVRRRPKAEVRERVAEALALVRLGALGGRSPGKLSGGQQQRVALARALVFRPRILLMDEPLGALDRQLREQMQIEIKHIQRSLGITAVYVTHDQQEALTMSDRIAVFNAGGIEQLDTPDVVYERPATAFVGGFVGESNRLEGTVVARDGPRCMVALRDGSTMQATLAGESGRDVVVLVRPERMRIEGGGAASGSGFAARVEEVIYQGEMLRVRMTLAGQEVVLKTANAGGVRPPAVGSDVRVGWDAADARAFGL